MLRKLARVTLNVLTVLSLVLCVGVCVLWAWSSAGRRGGQVTLIDLGSADAAQTRLYAKRGSIVLYRSVRLEEPPSGERTWAWVESLPWKQHERFGFAWWYGQDVGPVKLTLQGTELFNRYYCSFWLVAVPAWVVVSAAAALPAWRLGGAVRKWRSRRREAAGRCPACGYDLRATPGRCPECGETPIS